ncbi:hypothetical protein MANES_11G008702v8 [Manihot esculenta]|uniref:Cysteine proteinase inhibitor n=1 Tax=Manihot esculenta TaxID=3983 RepID=A0A2C9UX62_MANES|nr:hypothetical protein MANES_11G008702v8 [Manihot esculenta]
MATLGGVRDSQCAANSVEINALGRFAVDEHNKKEAKEQVVAGTLHHLTIEAIEAGKKKLYEANVWVKPGLNFKELQEFKHAGDVDADGPGSGWKEVPAHDPAVQDAANHAVKTIQQRSNSLFLVGDDYAKFNMLLKVKRGSSEEKFKVEVHKKNEGTFLLNQMEPHA